MARTRRSRRPALAALALLMPALAACQSGREVTGSIDATPEDHRLRHPIGLGDGPRYLDLFVEGPTGLSPRSRHDLANYLAEYRARSNSGLVVQVPAGVENQMGTQRALGAIREAAGGRAFVQSYRPTDPTIGSPIRLTFKRLQAKVTTACGTWPEDLGVSSPDFAFANRQWHNLGCAAQANLASQVADPNDLVRPRGETPPDTTRRMFNIGQLRNGDDPSTKWRVGSNVGSTITGGQ